MVATQGDIPNPGRAEKPFAGPRHAGTVIEPGGTS